jgi:CheY-like chemotaxis protein
LLAEDGLANQKLAVGLLEKWGLGVTVVANGIEAIEAWERSPFDLILMDLQMPEMDGITATKIIREREREKGTHIPIVAMTAHALAGDRERCLESGMDGYVSKPIRRSELVQETLPLLDNRDASEGDSGPSE